MKLFLHIGTEKTGSSFIQTVLSNNRPLLERNSIFFPKAGNREKGMKYGLISPGNGKALLTALQNDDLDVIVNLFKNYKSKASIKGCENILLSNENLITVLHDSKKLDLLRKCCLIVKLEIATSLLIIRNPIEQVISLYKHRAKHGSQENFKEWLLKDYKLPNYLKGIINQVNNNYLKILAFQYRRDSEYLIKVFFKNWLNVDDMPDWRESIVNPSLTFSELSFLSHLRKLKPAYVPFFYKEFLTIPIKNKSEDKLVKESMSIFLNQYLFQYNDVWKSVKIILQNKDNFVLPISSIGEYELETNVSFTKEQFNRYTEIWLETNKLKFKFFIVVNQFWKFLRRIKNKLHDYYHYNLNEKIKNIFYSKNKF